MLYHITMISLGLFLSLFLFYRFPTLRTGDKNPQLYHLSIIIPARNEEDNLALLLQDLKNQTYPIHEIICVDDCSCDNTAMVASAFGVKLITVLDKPPDWIGKSWACQKGAEAASGNLLLFIDADVRLKPTAIFTLVQAYEEHQCVISVQPYHQMMKKYEQFSLFFNLIQIAANGTTMIFACFKVGLYGPVILLNNMTYQAIGGHTSVKNSIVDDLSLGEKLTKMGFAFRLLLGGDFISFRMYRNGISDLLLGWTKNYASGALKTPLILFIMVFLWICSCLSVTIGILHSISIQNVLYLIIFSFLYLLWVLELFRISRHIGSFKKSTIICFPIYLVLFLLVFINSFFKKLFFMDVVWKDRKIKLEK
jgi:4,4'-diaponeurosporenoate glycosyltransferase